MLLWHLTIGRYLDIFMNSLFTRHVTTLAQLSDRRGACRDGLEDARRSLKEAFPGSDPLFPTSHDLEGDVIGQATSGQLAAARSLSRDATAEVAGLGRCFRQVHLCKLKMRYDKRLVSAARGLSRHYRERIQEIAAADPGPWSASGSVGTLRVVFASRPDADSRSLLNEAELLSECNAWKAPSPPSPQQPRRNHNARRGLTSQGEADGKMLQPRRSGEKRRPLLTEDRGDASGPRSKVWRSSAVCVTRVFGSGPQGGMLSDIAFMDQVDVLICIHGAACGNAYFMRNGSSLVGVRGWDESPPVCPVRKLCMIGPLGSLGPSPKTYVRHFSIIPQRRRRPVDQSPLQVEIRPAGISPNWANAYFFRQLQQENMVHW